MLPIAFIEGTISPNLLSSTVSQVSNYVLFALIPGAVLHGDHLSVFSLCSIGSDWGGKVIWSQPLLDLLYQLIVIIWLKRSTIEVEDISLCLEVISLFNSLPSQEPTELCLQLHNEQ